MLASGALAWAMIRLASATANSVGISSPTHFGAYGLRTVESTAESWPTSRVIATRLDLWACHERYVGPARHRRPPGRAQSLEAKVGLGPFRIPSVAIAS